MRGSRGASQTRGGLGAVDGGSGGGGGGGGGNPPSVVTVTHSTHETFFAPQPPETDGEGASILTDTDPVDGSIDITATLDHPRTLNIIITDTDASISAGILTVNGFDARGLAISDAISIAGVSGVTVRHGVKAFSRVTTAVITGLVGANVTDKYAIGYGTAFGLCIDTAGAYSALTETLESVNGQISANGTLNTTYATWIPTGGITGDTSEIWYTFTTVLDVTAGGGGSTTATAAVMLSFATIAELSAWDTTVLTTGDHAVAWVESLKRTFEFIPDSAASIDTVNFNYVAANPDGRWADSGDSNAQWLNTLDWYVDPTNGNNENTGATSIAALATFRELDKRLHGLVYTGGNPVTITLLTDANSDDPFIKNFGIEDVAGFGTLNIFGTMTVAATGTVSATQTSNSSTIQANFTSDLNPTTYLNRYVRLFAGATFKASCWIAKDLTGGVARTSATIDEQAELGDFGNSIPSLAGVDTVKVYGFPKLGDFYDNWPNASYTTQVNFIHINFDNEQGFHAMSTVSPVMLAGCSVHQQIYGFKSQSFVFDNCYAVAPLDLEGKIEFQAGGLFKRFSTTDWFIGDATVKFARNALFQGTSLTLFRCTLVNPDALAFFDAPASDGYLNLNSVQGSSKLIYGAGNLGNGIVFNATGIELNHGRSFKTHLFITGSGSLPNAAVAGNQIVMGDGIAYTYADLQRRKLWDRFGTEFFYADTDLPTIPYVWYDEPSLLVADGAVSKYLAVQASADHKMKVAKADTEAHASYVNGVSASTAIDTAIGWAVPQGYALLLFEKSDGTLKDPVVPGIAYLSEVTAGRGRVDNSGNGVPPPMVLTNQKLRLGQIVAAVGGSTGLAVVKFAPEMIPILSDGATP